MHRIPNDNKDAIPVLLQHGWDDCSEIWVMNDADLAPGMKLARAGFDVWFGNNRGNYYSNEHVEYTTHMKEYWDFDWEQMGTYDQPAQINHILQTTGHSKIGAYIGHSEGTTQFFAGSVLLPEYFGRTVSLYVPLAPVVRVDLGDSKLMKAAAEITPVLSWLIQKLKLWDLFPRNATSQYMGYVCTLLKHTCSFVETGIWNFNPDVDNLSRIPDRAAHSPSGAGWRNMVHYGQTIQAKDFVRFDYGAQENQKRYGQRTPPAYDLSLFPMPIAIFHGSLDSSASPEEVNWLVNESGIPKELIVHNQMLEYEHWSYQMALDTSYISNVTSLINQYW